MFIPNKLLRQTSIYLIGEILITAGGFISFPIFTRLLTKEEYGIMSLISISLMLVETLSSAGLRHSTQRFYSQYEGQDVIRFYSTVIYSSILFSLAGVMLVILSVETLSFFGLIDDRILHLFLLSVILIFARIITKIVASLYRVQENALKATLLMILNKYSGMFLSIFFIAVYYYGIWGFYLGLVIGELVVVFYCFVLVYRDFGELPLCINKEILKEMVTYGVPMVISGFATYVLSIADRYIIAFFESSEQVANYSVPYNLCTYISSAIVTAFQYSMIPIVMNSWNKGDLKDVDYHMQQVVKLYSFIAFPVVFGVISVGAELISFLASSKYKETSDLLVYFILAVMLHGFYTPLVIGLQFNKKTFLLLKITLIATLLNIVLNFIFVPAIGLYGAAIATLISIIVLLYMGGVKSYKYYKLKMPWASIAKYMLASILMYLIIYIFKSNKIIDGLISMILLGSVTYIVFLSVVDNDVRRVIIQLRKGINII